MAAWSIQCCFYTKPFWKRIQWKDIWWAKEVTMGVEERKKQKWNIKVQYISIVIIFERHTSSSILREKKILQDLKTIVLSTEPSRQHQPPDECTRRVWDLSSEEEQYTI